MRDFWRNLWQKYPEKQNSIVNLKTNTSFRGIIWDIRGKFMVMKNVEMMTNDGPKALDGEVVIQLSDVEFIQVI